MNDAPVFDLDLHVSLGVRDIPLQLHTSAKRIAIVGPSGAGKSTFLRILAGVQRRVRGRLRFAGSTWLDSDAGIHAPPEQRRIGWVPQDALLFPHVDVRRNLLGSRAARPERVHALAEALAIDTLLTRFPRHLSGGERQRVAIGRALLSEPALLLLDEPFAALDPARRRDVVGVLSSEVDRSELCVVLVSHDLDRVAPLVDRCFTLTECGFTETNPTSDVTTQD